MTCNTARPDTYHVIKYVASGTFIVKTYNLLRQTPQSQGQEKMTFP